MKLITQNSVFLLASLYTGIAFAGDGWRTNYEMAKEEASRSGRMLLIEITASDWCHPCMQLNEEVFKKDAFQSAMKDKFILLELDYPNDKSKQPAETIEQNHKLRETYGVWSYPTILLAEADGRPFARKAGYSGDGAELYVKNIEALLAKRKARDDGFAAAEKTAGVEKAKALIAVLETMELEDSFLDNSIVENFYADTVAAIKKSDPEDRTGFTKKYDGKQAEKKADKAATDKFFAAKKQIDEEKDLNLRMSLIDKTLEDYAGRGDLEPARRQYFTVIKGRVFASQGKFDDALKALEEAEKIDPDGIWGRDLDQLKKEYEEAKSDGGGKGNH